jgi:uncharacterized protein YdeI (BOF family)
MLVFLPADNRVSLRVGDRLTVQGHIADRRKHGFSRPVMHAKALQLAGAASIVFETSQPTSQSPASDSSQPPSKPSTDVDPTTPTSVRSIASLRSGDSVRVQGTVESINDDDEFQLRDETGRLEVYIGWRNTMPVSKGDRVTVQGVVDRDHPASPTLELYAKSITTADNRTIRLQLPTASPQIESGVAPSQSQSPAQLISSVKPGQRVHLQGTVARIADSDEFILKDDSGQIQIYIGYRNTLPSKVGDRVTIIGIADEQLLKGTLPEVYAMRLITSDGQSFTLNAHLQ